MNKLQRIFKPEPEDTLKLLKMVVEGHNMGIGHCTTCVNYVPTDYNDYCEKNCECFASKDCNEYKRCSIDDVLEEIKELEKEIEERDNEQIKCKSS